MRIPNRWSVAIGRIVVLAVVALGVASPAAAQIGALKRKAQKAAGAEAPAAPAETGAAPAAAPARAGGGGTVVLTTDVVDRLIVGLKAGKAERERAKKEDTPYGRYQKAQAAYAVAKPKCEAAQISMPNRMVADEKLGAKYTGFVEKAMAAQGKGDRRMYFIYFDSALALTDPSCVVKEPEQPQNYYEQQREVDSLAEQQTLKASDLDATEFGQAMDRATAILSGAAPPDASASESEAVSRHSAELKSLMGIPDKQQTGRTPKAAEAPPPAPAPAPAAVTMPTGAGAVSDCEVQNVKKHEAEIQALGDRGERAMDAGNNALMMAIADTIRQIQTAGCMRGK